MSNPSQITSSVQLIVVSNGVTIQTGYSNEWQANRARNRAIGNGATSAKVEIK
jgi:hypothetical protein